MFVLFCLVLYCIVCTHDIYGTYVYLSVCLSVCLSVHLVVSLSADLSVYACVYLHLHYLYLDVWLYLLTSVCGQVDWQPGR